MENLVDEIIYTDSKRISLTITQNGVVVLKIPKGISISKAENFVISKQNWIHKTKSKISSRNKAYSDFIEYKKVSILGKVFNLKYDPCYKTPTLTDYDLIIKDYKKLIAYYKKIAQDVLKERTDYLAKVMRLDNFSFKIDNSRTRWGSCSSTRQIKLNFRVVMLPHKYVDYIIIHELSHLRHMNHSQNFWREVEKYKPDYKKLKKDLTDYEFFLSMYREK